MARRRSPKLTRAAKPKFYLDESAAVWIADVLGRRYSVETAEQARLLGRSDADHFARCWRRGQVLITHDYDFWNYQNPEVPDTRNPGVIVFGCDNGNAKEIERILELFSPLATLIGNNGWRDTRIVIAPRGTVRVRRRESGTGNYEISDYRLNSKGVFEVEPKHYRKPKHRKRRKR